MCVSFEHVFHVYFSHLVRLKELDVARPRLHRTNLHNRCKTRFTLRGNRQLIPPPPKAMTSDFNIFSQRPIGKQGTVIANCNCLAHSPSTAVVHPTSGHMTQMFNSMGWKIGATRVSRGKIPGKLYVIAYLHVDGLGEEDVGRHEQAGVCTCSVAPLKSDDNWLICVE